MQDEAPLATLPADETSPDAAPPAENSCPRCQKPLIDPAGLGWCRTCGYCRSLEEEKSNQLMGAPRGPSQATALAGAAGQIPIWFWVLLLGIGGTAGLSLAAGQMLPAGNNLQRALWTSLQIVVGFVVMIAGQFVAVVMIAPHDEKLSFKDALVPTRLMGLIMKRLPRMAPCLWTSAWGVSLVVCAFLFVGGLNHWFRYLPNSKTGQSTSARR